MKYLIFLAILFFNPLFACDSNFDCEIGAQCIKQNAFGQGVCVGGMSGGGNSHDDNPYQWQVRGRMDDSFGKSCDSNFDCDIGAQCIKQGYSMSGVCN